MTDLFEERVVELDPLLICCLHLFIDDKVRGFSHSKSSVLPVPKQCVVCNIFFLMGVEEIL